MSQYNAKVMLRCGTSEEWKLHSKVVLLKAEPAIEYEADDSGKFTSIKLKFGDGFSNWSELPYFLNTNNENILTIEDLERVLPEVLKNSGYESITEEDVAKLIDASINTLVDNSIKPLNEKIVSIDESISKINTKLVETDQVISELTKNSVDAASLMEAIERINAATQSAKELASEAADKADEALSVAKTARNEAHDVYKYAQEIDSRAQFALNSSNMAYTLASKAESDARFAVEKVNSMSENGTGLSEENAKKLSSLSIETTTIMTKDEETGEEIPVTVDEVLINCGTSELITAAIE